jgi:Trypsin
VGYGVTSQDKGGGVSPYDSWKWDRYRNFGVSELVQSDDTLSSMFLKLTADPGQDKGGTTFGDSGGPIFKGGTNIVLGLNSFVNNSNCDGVTYAQRVHRADILAWINGGYLK